MSDSDWYTLEKKKKFLSTQTSSTNDKYVMTYIYIYIWFIENNAS